MPPRAPAGNRLLQSLSPRDRSLLATDLVPTDLKVRDWFERPNRKIEHVLFPTAGVASVVAEHPNGRRIEIGLIGNEGMSGTAVVLGSDRSPHATYIQMAGAGYRLSVTALRRAMEQSATLRAVTLKFVQAFMVQTAHSAIANARATLNERLARWLLMAHDRARADALPLTHEFLSLMMAVRRAGVTEALQDFEEQGLIVCGRRAIEIIDRKGIEKIASHYYGTPEAEYRRLMK